METALHVDEPAEKASSALTHFRELYRAEVRGKPVSRHASFHDTETFLCQCVCARWKVQPRIEVLGPTRGPYTVSEPTAG